MISARAAQSLAEPAGPVMHVQGVGVLVARRNVLSGSGAAPFLPLWTRSLDYNYYKHR